MVLVHRLSCLLWACLRVCHTTGSSYLLLPGLNCSTLCASCTLRFQLNWYLLSEALLDLSHFPITGLHHRASFLHSIHLSLNFTFILCGYLLNGSLSHRPINATRAGEGRVLIPHEVAEPHTVYIMMV
uniref:Secreted protein n=1 Tax=Molossus molossus TaxID=27622 RepID=A0A7J8J6F5_MOLMO|nr:hypothetical protein HJG59_009649 [Molossus molossus]